MAEARPVRVPPRLPYPCPVRTRDDGTDTGPGNVDQSQVSCRGTPVHPPRQYVAGLEFNLNVLDLQDIAP